METNTYATNVYVLGSSFFSLTFDQNMQVNKFDRLLLTNKKLH